MRLLTAHAVTRKAHAVTRKAHAVTRKAPCCYPERMCVHITQGDDAARAEVEERAIA